MKYSFHREAILDIVGNSSKHYSVDSVYRKLKELIPNVSKMTVYRNLNMLLRKGKILEFFVDNVGHYCGGETNHFHFACVKCDEVKDSSIIGSELSGDIQSSNFAPLSSGFVIKGICNDCQCFETEKE